LIERVEGVWPESVSADGNWGAEDSVSDQAAVDFEKGRRDPDTVPNMYGTSPPSTIGRESLSGERRSTATARTEYGWQPAFAQDATCAAQEVAAPKKKDGCRSRHAPSASRN